MNQKLLQFTDSFCMKLSNTNENYFQTIFLIQPKVWWARRFSSMPSAVQPNGRYSLKLLNIIVEFPKHCPKIRRPFLSIVGSIIWFNWQDKSQFWLEMQKIKISRLLPGSTKLSIHVSNSKSYPAVCPFSFFFPLVYDIQKLT